MNFKEIPVNKFLEKGYVRTKVVEFVQSFIDAEIPVAEVSWGEYANITSAQSTITQAAKRMNVPHIKATVREGKLYVYNELLLEKEGYHGTQAHK